MRPVLLAFGSPALAGLSLLVSACGSSSGASVAQGSSTTIATKTSGTTSTGVTGSAQQQAVASALAYSRCMRSHGVPAFPDPDSQGQYPPFHSDSAASKQESVSAQETCKSLLSKGGSAGRPQDRQQKLAFALQVAGCLRAHGYPTFPDPTASSEGTSQNLGGAGIDSSSPQFQAAELACESQAQKTLGLR
ncbi:MAG TPA: hypothetical protein VG652_02105 [Gaiellaceae bacterium]|nr:hypothetical protein [Gaiellaceae bacterium]